MGQAIPRQQPAVVLRSQFNQLRALLAVLLVAVAGLTATVVILATNDEADTSGRSASEPSALTPQVKRGSAYADAISALTPAQLAAAFGHGTSVVEAKHEATTAAAIGQSNDGTVTGGSKTDPHGPASLLP